MKRLLLLLLLLPSLALATVPASTSRVAYTCNGVTVNHPFTFGVTDSSDLTVITRTSTGTDTTLVEGVGYTVSCTNQNCTNGGTVVVSPACASGTRLTILRSVPVTQETDFIEGMPSLVETFESELDKQVEIDQQITEKLNRSPKIAPGSSYSGNEYTFPDPVAGKSICWNAAATALTTCDAGGATTTPAALAGPWVLDTDYATLALADADAATKSKLLIITQPWATVPDGLNADIKVVPGGELTIANGQTVTFNGGFYGPPNSLVGTGTTVFNGSRPVYAVSTVAQLRAVPVGTQWPGAIQLLGYYGAGDGAGGPLRVLSSGAAPGTYTDNGGTVIVPTGGDGSLAWTFTASRVETGWFGSQCDGNAVIDNSTPLNNALLSFQGVSGGTVDITGTAPCYYGTTLRMLNGTTLEGLFGTYSGPDLTLIDTLTYTGTGHAIEGYSGPADLDSTRDITIHNLTLGLTGNGATGIYFEATKNSTIDDVVIRSRENNQTAIELYGTKGSRTYYGNYYNLLSHIKLVGASAKTGTTGLKAVGVTDLGMNNSNTFTAIELEDFVTGYDLDGMMGNYFYNINAQSVTTGVKFGGDSIYNKIFGLYEEHATVPVNFVLGSQDNEIDGYRFNGTTAPIASCLFTGANNRIKNGLTTWTGSGSTQDIILAGRLIGDSANRVEIRQRGVFLGDGASSPNDNPYFAYGSNGRLQIMDGIGFDIKREKPGTVTTTDATATTVVSRTPSVSSMVQVIARARAFKDTTDVASYTRRATFRKLANGNLALVGSVQGATEDAETAGAAAWDVGFTYPADTINLQVTGAAGTTIKWEGNIEVYELK